MRFLLVGDVHSTVEDLSDCDALLRYVGQVADQVRPNYILFMGDQHNNHSVVRVEVLDFWTRWLSRLAGPWTIGMLVGNHDRPHNHAMSANSLVYTGCEIIAEPKLLGEGVLAVPWMADGDKFVRTVGDTKLVFTHMTFNGAKYENGFFAQDGLSPSLCPNTYFVSGHIHVPSRFGNVWYIGAPRWRSASDANTDRHIWSLDVEDGVIVGSQSFSTTGICKSIYRLVDSESEPATPVTYPQPFRCMVDVHGSEDWVRSRKAYWIEKGYSVATFIQREKHVQVRESDGIATSLERHTANYRPQFGTPIDHLRKMAAERIRL